MGLDMVLTIIIRLFLVLKNEITLGLDTYKIGGCWRRRSENPINAHILTLVEYFVLEERTSGRKQT